MCGAKRERTTKSNWTRWERKSRAGGGTKARNHDDTESVEITTTVAAAAAVVAAALEEARLKALEVPAPAGERATATRERVWEQERRTSRRSFRLV